MYSAAPTRHVWSKLRSARRHVVVGVKLRSLAPKPEVYPIHNVHVYFFIGTHSKCTTEREVHSLHAWTSHSVCETYSTDATPDCRSVPSLLSHLHLGPMLASYMSQMLSYTQASCYHKRWNAITFFACCNVIMHIARYSAAGKCSTGCSCTS